MVRTIPVSGSRPLLALAQGASQTLSDVEPSLSCCVRSPDSCQRTKSPQTPRACSIHNSAVLSLCPVSALSPLIPLLLDPVSSATSLRCDIITTPDGRVPTAVISTGIIPSVSSPKQLEAVLLAEALAGACWLNKQRKGPHKLTAQPRDPAVVRHSFKSRVLFRQPFPAIDT